MDITKTLNVFPSEELNLDGMKQKEIFGFRAISTSTHFSHFPHLNDEET